MSLWLEGEAGRFTNVKDKGKAAAARMLVAASQAWREAYGELQLPAGVDVQKKPHKKTDTRNREAIISPLSAETQKLVEHMRRDGYAVYDTTGRTPASLKTDGMRYWFLNDKLADITAPQALLAFKKAPSELFLPGSSNIPHDEQVKLLPEEQANVDAKYPGAGLVVDEGELPEWTELAWTHFQATGRKVRLFGKDFGYYLTWTKTYENNQQGAHRASFGDWDETDGADADLWGPDGVNPGLRLASLVRIPRK